MPSLDDTDLLALQYMIPSTILQDEPIQTVLQCAASMTACQFQDFWKNYERLKTYDADPAIADMAQQQIVQRQHATPSRRKDNSQGSAGGLHQKS